MIFKKRSYKIDVIKNKIEKLKLELQTISYVMVILGLILKVYTFNNIATVIGTIMILLICTILIDYVLISKYYNKLENEYLKGIK